jgi:CubicO group peptidase (beta-lactamase class C family)
MNQATLANWRNAPYNRWAFQHVREIVPSADIPNDPDRVAKLPAAPSALGVEALLDRTDTDALVVLHRGKLVYERYAHGMAPATPHIFMSVSKSMLGLLAGILAERRILEPQRLVTDVVPELAGTAYAGATVRHLLDMRAGVAFDEDYLATAGPIVEYRKSTGWNPLAPGEPPSDLRSFFSTLRERDGPHEGRFHYISPNTDLLGWVIERAAGRRYADLMSELLWQPVGAERSAYITVDRLGAPRCAGGFCAAARDLARVGQAMVEGRVIPEAWVDDIAEGGDRTAWEKGVYAAMFPAGTHYRGKWYVFDGWLTGWGIHGQHIAVDRRRGLVIAKFSSQAQPVDEARFKLTLQLFADIRNRLG